MRADDLLQVVGVPVVTGGIYLLLAGEVSAAEGMACACVVVLVGLYAIALTLCASRPMRLPLRAAKAIAGAIAGVVPDLVRVARVILGLAPPAEHAARQPFRFGGDTLEEAGRRAAVVLALSLAPNGFVVDVEQDGDLMVHRLQRVPEREDREWPA